MADGSTPNLGLIKPEVGASKDTWGNKTNGNWDTIDANVQTIAGMATAVPANLPARLGAAAGLITDWNTATEAGWYTSNAAANGPSGTGTNLLIGQVLPVSAANLIQIVTTWTGDPNTNSNTWRRDRAGSTWTAWAQVNPSIAQLAAVYAPLASPAFTGNPTAPTAATGDSDTSIATTAFVQREKAISLPSDVTGSTYTLQAADAGKTLTFTNAAGCAITVPSAVFAPGNRVDLIHGATAGPVTLVAGSGMTLQSKDAKLGLNGLYTAASVYFRTAAVGVLVGDLV